MDGPSHGTWPCAFGGLSEFRRQRRIGRICGVAAFRERSERDELAGRGPRMTPSTSDMQMPGEDAELLSGERRAH
jgi:hypothetical protein